MQNNNDAAFIDCIFSFSRHLKESGEVSAEMRDLFFNMAKQRSSLPANSPKETIDSFLTTLVLAIGTNIGKPMSIDALEVLFKYVKNGKNFLISHGYI